MSLLIGHYYIFTHIGQSQSSIDRCMDADACIDRRIDRYVTFVFRTTPGAFVSSPRAALLGPPKVDLPIFNAFSGPVVS